MLYIAYRLLGMTVAMARNHMSPNEANIYSNAKLYFRANLLFFPSGPLEWTVSHVIPNHISESLNRFVL